MEPVLIDFEESMGLKPVEAADLLGTAYVTYTQYRTGRRLLPQYHRNHVRALLLLHAVGMIEVLLEESHGEG